MPHKVNVWRNCCLLRAPSPISSPGWITTFKDEMKSSILPSPQALPPTVPQQKFLFSVCCSVASPQLSQPWSWGVPMGGCLLPLPPAGFRQLRGQPRVTCPEHSTLTGMCTERCVVSLLWQPCWREHPRSCWCKDWYSCVCSINSSWVCWQRLKHDRYRGWQHPAAWSPGPLQRAVLSEQVDVHGSGLCSSFCLLPLPPLQFYWVPSKREHRAADFPVGFPCASFIM